MTHGTNSAYALRDAGHFGKWTAFAEFLKSAELDHVKFGIRHISGVVDENADFGVSFDAGHRIDYDAF